MSYKGLRFYRDVTESPLDGEEIVNVVAVFADQEPYWEHGVGHVKEAIVPTFFHNNSATSIGSVPVGWVAEAEEVTVEEARELHPRLMKKVDRADRDFPSELKKEIDALFGGGTP